MQEFLWGVFQGMVGGALGMLILLACSNNYDRWKLGRLMRKLDLRSDRRAE